MSSESAGMSVGTMASSVTGSLANLSKLITSASYIAGLGFSIASITKFKQHKDNPAQFPVSTSSALAVLAAIQTYLPSIEAPSSAAGVTASEARSTAS